MKMKEFEIINKENITELKVALVYGQMNEPPEARVRVGLTALIFLSIFKKFERNTLFLNEFVWYIFKLIK